MPAAAPLIRRGVNSNAVILEAEAIQARAAAVTKRLAAIQKEADAIDGKIGRMDEDDQPAELVAAIEAAKKALQKLDERIWGTAGGQGIVRRRGLGSEIRGAARSLSSSWDAPTAPERVRLRRAAGAADKLIAAFNELLGGPISSFATALGEAELSFAPDLTEIK